MEVVKGTKRPLGGNASNIVEQPRGIVAAACVDLENRVVLGCAVAWCSSLILRTASPVITVILFVNLHFCVYLKSQSGIFCLPGSKVLPRETFIGRIGAVPRGVHLGLRGLKWQRDIAPELSGGPFFVGHIVRCCSTIVEAAGWNEDLGR